MQHYFILGIILVAVMLFAFEVIRPDLVAIGLTLLLVISGIVTVDEGFSGFSNPAVITVIAMFILSSALVRTGVADYVSSLVLRIAGSSPVLLTLSVMTAVGTLSAFMNNIGAVAVLLPTMFVVARRSNYPVTKLLIPLSFGSLLGGLTTLIGTPPNLLVSIALEKEGFEPFRLFDFLPTGVAVMVTGALYMAFVGRHLMPVPRRSADLTKDYQLQKYLSEAYVPSGSSLAGKTVAESRIRRDMGLTILRVNRREGDQFRSFVPKPETTLQEGDLLIVEGDLSELLRTKGGGQLGIHAERKFTDKELTGEAVTLAEVAIAPKSELIGRAIWESNIRRRHGVLVLALRRRTEMVQHDFISVPLEVGDVLLVQGPEEAIVELAQSPHFLVVNRLEHEARQLAKAPLAIAIMGGAILAAATGLLHISVAGMLGALLVAITGCVRVQDMYKAVEWRVIFLIAFMMPLGIAMDDAHVGTARWLAEHVVAWTGESGPLLVMAALFLFTTTITEVMSNAAAAVLVGPVGIAIATGMGFEPYPFLMAVAIGASTTFLTPIGHQANVLVYGIGNYRFVDFPKVGFLLNVLIFIVSMILIPIVWPFTPIH